MMIWQRKPKPDTAAALDAAGNRMMEAIASGRGRGMAWIEFLAADAAHEAEQREADDAVNASHPERERKAS